MSYRSTALIVIIVFGILFSLFYSSAYVSTENKETLLRDLQVEREDASIVRMVKPEHVCFSADQKLLDRYPSLVQAIKMADDEAGIDSPTNGNYYTGVGVGLNKTQIFHSRNNPYAIFLYSSTPEEEVKGIIEVYAQKIYEGNPNSMGYEFYQHLVENSFNYKEPSFSVKGETSYLKYYDGRLSVVNVYTADESYRLVGSIPMQELVNTAQSMFDEK